MWLPQQDEEEGFQPRGMRMRQSTASSTVANLFEGHPTVQQHMVTPVWDMPLTSTVLRGSFDILHVASASGDPAPAD